MENKQLWLHAAKAEKCSNSGFRKRYGKPFFFLQRRRGEKPFIARGVRTAFKLVTSEVQVRPCFARYVNKPQACMFSFSSQYGLHRAATKGDEDLALSPHLES